ncbi:MAG: hypothetical protein COA78_34320 [Blastopirellula sp.]|nr:MAG: hypothetical protein COA78_34320 [Blastopirellula sp.]
MNIGRQNYLDSLKRNQSGGIPGDIMIGGKLMHCPDKELVEKSKQLVSKNVDDGIASKHKIRVSDEDGKFRGYYDLEDANKLIAQCNAMTDSQSRTDIQKSSSVDSEDDENNIFDSMFCHFG